MSVNQQETFTKYKSNKTISTNKTKKTFLSEINSRLVYFKKILIWLFSKINILLSKCSMVTHFTLILIPISFLFVFLIFFIHIKFYDTLFRFNYYKGVKEEFYDAYITEIDDMQSTIQMLIIKENNLDFENLFFFEVLYNELIYLGILDETNYTFPGIAHNSEDLYKIYQTDSVNCEYTIPKEDAKRYLDERPDSLKELSKIYYYLLPTINYGYKYMGVAINQTFLLAYEFNSQRKIIGNEPFFAFPRSNYHTKANNFVVSHRYLNPIVERKDYTSSPLIDDSYYMENFFQRKDYLFRKNLNIEVNNSFSQLSLSHFNYELNGNITKSILSTLQIYINYKEKK